MKKISLFLLIALAATGCGRNSRDVWEDTKTCGHYMGRGVRSFFGKHDKSGEYGYYIAGSSSGSGATNESEFVALEDATGMASLGMSDYIPISRESPGDPNSSLPGIDGFYDPSGRLAQLFSKVHFGFDSFAIQGEENLKALQEIARYMSAHPETYVFVEGHADERGAAAYNLALGSRRANAVRTFLVQNGVNPDQLFTISYGKERPLAMGHDEQSHNLNRRAQFKLYDR